MAVTSTVLDGNNVALVYAGSVSANVFTLNYATGAVTSSYLPADWCAVLTANARTLSAVTTLAQRQTVEFLDRLIAIGSLDGATISTNASVGAGTATLVVTVETGDPVNVPNPTILVQLPHSIFGAASLGQSVPATGGGGGGSVVPSDLGLVPFTGNVDGAVGPGDLVSLNTSGVLVRADKANASAFPCIGAYGLDSVLSPCVRVAGEVAVSGGPFLAGTTLYVGTAGAATATATNTPGDTRQLVGVVQSNGNLFVAIGLMEVV
jgi:hypothetical protein